MVRARYRHSDFLRSALALIAEHGLAALTVAAITSRLNAPTGSFYHRFASRDALLGELWFETVLSFQQGIEAALKDGDGLKAALHTPAWVRQHPQEARLLLLYHRDDFAHAAWPQTLLDGLAEQKRQGEARLQKLARELFGFAGPDELRCVQFVLAEAPVAAVRQHLYRNEPPPPIVDRIITDTYHSVVQGHLRALGQPI